MKHIIPLFLILIYPATTLTAHTVAPDIAFNPSDARVWAAGDGVVGAIWGSGSLTIWDVNKAVPMTQHPLLSNKDSPSDLAFSQNKLHLIAVQYMSGAADDRHSFIALFDYVAGNVMWRLDTTSLGINFIDGFSPDAKYLICGSTDGKIYDLSLSDGSAKCIVSFADLLKITGRHLNAVQVSSSGKYYCAIFNDAAYCRDAIGQDMWSIRLDPNADIEEFNIVYDKVVLLNGASNQIELRDFHSGKITLSMRSIDPTRVRAISTNQYRIVVATNTSVLVQNSEDADALPLEGAKAPSDVAVTADGGEIVCLPAMECTVGVSGGKPILSAHRFSDTAKVFDGKTGKQIRELNMAWTDHN